ncbi:MAG: pyridoxamine 5'-phosphate oxidase family protein [Marmoricola sp.]
MLASVEIYREECESLLRGAGVGRVAVSTPTGPHIVPVNYTVVDGAILVRTTPYSVLGTHGRNALLAFEVDQFDSEQHGWSVMARGRAEVVTSVEDIDHIRQAWSPSPWLTGGRHMFLRLPMNDLSGRRVGGPVVAAQGA